MTRLSGWSAALLAAALAGCGLHVPEMQEWYEPREDQKFTENILINNVKCELHKGLVDALERYNTSGKKMGHRADWFKSWIATVTLKLSVQERASVNPGLSWVRPISDVSTFALGAGASVSTDATRVETISFSYPLGALYAAGAIKGACEDPNQILAMGDLKIGQFIDKKVFLSTIPGTIVGPYSAFNYQVTFVVVYGGSATPTWRLVDVTANPNSPFLEAARTRTHDIAITLAPPGDPAAAEAALLHNAALIGQAVASAIRRNRN